MDQVDFFRAKLKRDGLNFQALTPEYTGLKGFELACLRSRIRNLETVPDEKERPIADALIPDDY